MQAYLSALQEIPAYHLANQSAKEALTYLERAIPLDRLNEDLYCQAMRAYSALNDRAGIAQKYQ